MSEHVQTAVFEILKSIQTKLVEHDRRFDQVDARFERLEDLVRKQRRDSAAMLVMMKGTAGLYEERLNQLEVDRIVKIEERLAALEARRS